MPCREPTPPPNWSLHEWAALPEAFNRVVASGGLSMLGFHGLRQDLLSGRLESALRQISRDGQETWRSLKPSDWRQWRLQLQRTFQSKPPEIKVIPIDKDEALDEHQHCFLCAVPISTGNTPPRYWHRLRARPRRPALQQLLPLPRRRAIFAPTTGGASPDRRSSMTGNCTSRQRYTVLKRVEKGGRAPRS